jgi:uncharacterized protein (DUF2267 family)
MAHTETSISAIDRTVQKTLEWIKDTETALDREDPHFAFQALRGVLHILRDRIPLATAVHLGDQLPILIRGLYYENWTPTHEAKHRERNLEEFLDRMHDYFPKEPVVDTEGIARAVFKVLQARVTAGEIRAVRAALPERFLVLWE